MCVQTHTHTRISGIGIDCRPICVRFYRDLREQLEVERQRFHTIVMSPPHVLMFLTPGRIVEVTIVDSNARPPRKVSTHTHTHTHTLSGCLDPVCFML